jgi:glutamine amidotransferase-like uncharacterized protein
LTLFLLSSSLPFAHADKPYLKADDSLELPDDLHETKVALLTWSGALLPAVEKMFEYMNFTTETVNGNEINNGALDDFDILVCPGGSGSPFEDLGMNGINKIRDFIENGGGYFGICAGALYASDYFVWKGVQSFEPPFDEEIVMGKNMNFDLFPGVGYFPIEEISVNTAMTKINIVDRTHPITDSLPDHMHIFYAQGPYLEPYENANITVLATYDVTGKPAIVAFQYGKGKVLLSGVHPEYEMDSDRDGNPPDPEFSDEGSDWPLVVEAMKWLTPSPGSRTTRTKIPGFTYEAFTVGITVGILLLWWMRERVK